MQSRAKSVLHPRSVLALVAGASIAVAAVAVGLLPRQPPVSAIARPTIAPGTVWPGDFVLHKGDRAVGAGQLVARDGEPTRLCTGKDGLVQVVGAQYRCSPLSVEVRGVDARALERARTFAGATVVDSIVLRGTWDGAVLAVDAIGGNAIRLPVSPPLNCQFEVPGAANEDTQAPETEEAYLRLQSALDADPVAYAGMWVANEGRRMAIVATTHEIVSAGVQLRRVFPFALCVVHVRYSTSELSRFAEEIEQPKGAWWWPEIAVERNRVLVRVPTLDEEVIKALEHQPATEPVPLLMFDR